MSQTQQDPDRRPLQEHPLHGAVAVSSNPRFRLALSYTASNCTYGTRDTMKVFLSWSGERAKAMAEFLQNWLPDVIQVIDPWVSSQSITQGSRPLTSIADELSGCNFGIVCVTPESKGSEWVLFEAGALSKVLEESMVVPLLLDIEKAQVTGPLSQFQMTLSTDRDEVFKLVSDINKRLGDSALAPDRLVRSFEQNWPSLQEELVRITSLEQPRKEQTTQKRSADDRLDEVLLLARQQDRRLTKLERALDILRRGPQSVAESREGKGSARSMRDSAEDEERRKVDLAFRRLEKYDVKRMAIGENSIRATVGDFPDSDTAAAAEFRQTVEALANEIELSILILGNDKKSYKHDWPF
ncbi:toll/interleukin-1 receptor domain-containing protein [Streptomyces chartreusis]|uniref:toll/interleukin-1 receptor domain-containing protein n=1 Tax=Streptomyces chartreusis TaxID=1969 RepID=UPI0037F1BEC1